MTDTPKSMLDEINADLAAYAGASGPQKIAELIAERWDIPAADIIPYLVAIALQVAVVHDTELATNPADSFKRLESIGYRVVLAAVAAEKIGWAHIMEHSLQLGPYPTATALAADTFELTDEPSETTH